MWRVSWYGSYSEFCRCFDSEEEAREFYNSLTAKKKEIYK